MTREVERTDDGRFIVVDGRRWRTADPALPEDVRARLLHHLGVARSGVRTRPGGTTAAVAAARARVQLAKTGLGERGDRLVGAGRRRAAGPVGGGAAGTRRADRDWAAMQTFLPVADFAESARLLDSPRLGKQRVETLQILRALELPDYGWANHPAVLMWRGRTAGAGRLRPGDGRGSGGSAGFADSTDDARSPSSRPRSSAWPQAGPGRGRAAARRGWATRSCTARTGPT